MPQGTPHAVSPRARRDPAHQTQPRSARPPSNRWRCWRKPRRNRASGTPEPPPGCSATRAWVSNLTTLGMQPAPGPSPRCPCLEKTHKSPPPPRKRCQNWTRPADTQAPTHCVARHTGNGSQPNPSQTDRGSPCRSGSPRLHATNAPPPHPRPGDRKSPDTPQSSANPPHQCCPSPQTAHPTTASHAAFPPPWQRSPTTPLPQANE